MSTQDMQEADSALGRLGFASVALVITAGPDKNKRFPLKAGENVIGRAPDAQVRLDENEISRRHTRITVGQEIQVEDLGSALGTFLNGRLMMGLDFVFDNDEIRIGPYTLKVEIKRQESRRGIKIALGCLAVALLLFAVAVLFPDAITPSERGPQQTTQDGKERELNAWRNWETLTLPGVEALKAEGVSLTAEAADVQFRFATRLFQDRFADPGNAYQALLYYKRALAVLPHVGSLDKRPCIARRSLDRIALLQEMIGQECEKRVFAFQRANELQWWDECLRVLGEVTQVCPWSGDRYHQWASQQARLLKRILQG